MRLRTIAGSVRFLLGMCVVAPVPGLAAPQQVYVSMSPSGLPSYSDASGGTGSRLYLTLGDPPPRPRARRDSAPGMSFTAARPGAYAALPDRSFEVMTLAASRAYGVPNALLLAVMHAESHFNPNARSPVGAIGLMQVMPPTGARYGVRRGLSDPLTNIDVGARYLKDLLLLFKGDEELAVAAYNAGEGAVMKYGRRIPPYPETRAYVPRVMRLYVQYRTRGPAPARD